jgi:hypothetical protein
MLAEGLRIERGLLWDKGEIMAFESATASGARAPVPGDVPGSAQLELSARSRALLRS